MSLIQSIVVIQLFLKAKRLLLRILFFAIPFFSNIKSANAYFEFDSRLETAYVDILSLRFKEAQILIDLEKKEKPGNDLSLLYENYIDFLKSFLTEEKTQFEKFKKDAAIRIDRISKKDISGLSPFYLYSLAEIYIQQALVRIKFEEHLAAATEIRKAFKLIERNTKLYPSFVLNQKVSGFLHAIVGAVPSKYNWIVNIAGMEGNVSEGIAELQKAYVQTGASPYKSYQTEILFYLGTTQSVFAPSTDAIPLIQTMKTTASTSPLIAYVYSNIMMKKGQNEESLWALDAAIAKKDAYPFTFLYYKRGLCKLRKMDLNSDSDFNYFNNNYNGINNIKSAWQKLAWNNLLKGDTAAYKRNLKSCLQSGSALLDEDRDAQLEANSGEVINVYLLRSRLYFDGGYYQKALSELTTKDISNFHRFKDQLEITYRIGRIMQMNGNIDKAIRNYEITIKNGSSSPWHFAANSSLMLGTIYENKKEYDKALKYYQLCLTMDFDQYKNSIEQKAKAGVERVSKMK